MDILNRVMIPCVLMLIASALLVHSIYKMKILQQDYTMRMSLSNQNWTKKQVELAFSSIVLNTIYITITLPFPVVLLFGDYISDPLLYLKFYLFCIGFSINFYILLLMNKLFRKEFISTFRNIFLKPNVNHSIEMSMVLPFTLSK